MQKVSKSTSITAWTLTAKGHITSRLEDLRTAAHPLLLLARGQGGGK